MSDLVPGPGEALGQPVRPGLPGRTVQRWRTDISTIETSPRTAVRPAPPSFTHDEVVARARAMIPTLRARAGEAEAMGEIHPETHADFTEAGFYRIAQPKRFGGPGLDLDTVGAVVFELARGDPSAAWVAGFYAIHNHSIGTYPIAGQEDYWADGALPNMASASFMASGSFEDVEGGVVVSGEWDFCSGINHADWLQVYRHAPDGLTELLIPRGDFSIIHNWKTVGARATASNRAHVERAFVPSRRIADGALVAAGRSPALDHHDTPSYRLPYYLLGGRSIAYTIVGAAQGLIDVFQETALKRSETISGSPFIERVPNQLRLAESSAEVDAARELLDADTRRIMAWAAEGAAPTILERARVRRNSGFAVKLAVAASGRIFDVTGAHALYDGNPIQRYFRDVTAMSHTLPALWDPPAEQYGRVAWGLEPTSGMM